MKIYQLYRLQSGQRITRVETPNNWVDARTTIERACREHAPGEKVVVVTVFGDRVAYINASGVLQRVYKRSQTAQETVT